MLVLSDQVKEVEEQRKRINFRIERRIKKPIQPAPARAGVDDSVCTLTAAYSPALKIIAAMSEFCAAGG